MNRRKFISLLSVAVALPREAIAAAREFAKAAEAKPEILKKEILSVDYTCSTDAHGRVVYSDQSCEWLPMSAIPAGWRK